MSEPLTTREKQIRNALADYMGSEGCVSCCGDRYNHGLAEERLGELLKVPKYKDGSGRDFGRFETTTKPTGKRRRVS